MMKQKLQGLFSGILIGSLLTGGGALAKSGSEMIEAWYSDIKIIINGTQITPKDAGGNVVEPFLYNGTTYLPIRAIGEALGKEVSWDGDTRSVYLNDTKKPTETVETPEPTSTPVPTPEINETVKETPSQHTVTTTEILQISGYRKEAIKGEITLAWDSDKPNAEFTAKMRCNNGGLADYVDCHITMVETLATSDYEITGKFRVTLNDAIKYQDIEGTLTIADGTLSLHTREYDYKLVAALQPGEAADQTKLISFMSFQTIKMDGMACHGMMGLECAENPEDTTFSGSFIQEEKKYTIQLDAVEEITSNELTGTFSVLCNGTPLISRSAGTLKDLSAELGDALTLTIDGFSPVSIRLVEIGY